MFSAQEIESKKEGICFVKMQQGCYDFNEKWQLDLPIRRSGKEE